MRKSTKKNPFDKKRAPQSLIFLCGATTNIYKKAGNPGTIPLPESYFHFFIAFLSAGVASIRLNANPPLRASLAEIRVLAVTIPFFI